MKLRSNSSYQTISAKRNKLPETNYHIELKALSIFFSIFVGEWNKFDSTIRDVESIKWFTSMLMNLLSLKEILFLIHDSVGVNLISRLWPQFIDLNEYKICHNFKISLSLMCSCGAETTSQFFLLFQYFPNEF